jgi:hypothetical protein
VTITYKYLVSGTAADGQTWTVTGVIENMLEGDFALVPDAAMRTAFEKLTRGRAIYGRPGVGCEGPYTFTRLTIERAGSAEEGPGRREV